VTIKHSKSRDKLATHRRRRNRKAIRCLGAMITPRRGLIFAQTRAIQQVTLAALRGESDAQTRFARDEIARETT
jgi:hypothetical protein